VLVVGDRADLDDEGQVGQDGVDAADPSVERLAAADLIAAGSGQRCGVGDEVLGDDLAGEPAARHPRRGRGPPRPAAAAGISAGGLGPATPPRHRPATALRAVLIWSRLHGIVSLEIAGNFASMGLDPGQLFEIQLATLTA